MHPWRLARREVQAHNVEECDKQSVCRPASLHSLRLHSQVEDLCVQVGWFQASGEIDLHLRFLPAILVAQTYQADFTPRYLDFHCSPKTPSFGK